MIRTKVQVDPGLKKLIEGLGKVDEGVRETTWEGTLEIAYDMENFIKGEIPVDTGRAKASWGHFTPEDLKGVPKKLLKKRISKRTKFQARGEESGRTQIASASDAVWIENKAESSVEQGTLVDYTKWLDWGSAGRTGLLFTDRAMARALRSYGKLSNQMTKVITAILEGRKPTLERITTFRFRTPSGRKTLRV